MKGMEKMALSLHYYDRLPFITLHFAAFLILLIGFNFIFKLIKALLDSIIKITWHPLIEKFGGFLIGLMRSVVVTSTIIILIAFLPFSYLQWSIRDKSLTGKYVLMAGPEIYSKVSAFLPTIKLGEPSSKKEDMLKNLMSDKSLAPKKPAHKPSS